MEEIESYPMKIVVCGENHSMALNEWGEIFTWGCNSNGQLGD